MSAELWDNQVLDLTREDLLQAANEMGTMLAHCAALLDAYIALRDERLLIVMSDILSCVDDGEGGEDEQ